MGIIEDQFEGAAPRVIVLDDVPGLREMAALEFSEFGFDVEECATSSEFFAKWSPGLYDVIVADWDLAKGDTGESVLEAVREKDWDVPFVLISGRLDQDGRKSEVLESLLDSGSARFVRRGDNGFENACSEAIELIERRDLALLKILLKYRQAALDGGRISTSSGDVSVKALIAELVRTPLNSQQGNGPIADLIARRLFPE